MHSIFPIKNKKKYYILFRKIFSKRNFKIIEFKNKINLRLIHIDRSKSKVVILMKPCVVRKLVINKEFYYFLLLFYNLRLLISYSIEIYF
jgi:hypothetical protein